LFESGLDQCGPPFPPPGPPTTLAPAQHSAEMAEIWIDKITALCSKSEGRDKLARFFQYGARALAGFIDLAAPTVETPLHSLEGHARSVMTQLAGARRTHRWCKELPIIASIPKTLANPDLVEGTLDLLTKGFLAAFFMLDHVGHLKQWKILPGGKRNGAGTIQLGLKFFCLSNIIGVLLQIRKYLKLHAAWEDEGHERHNCSLTMLKHVFLVVQTAHLSLLYPTHDALVGVFGMITSALAVRAQWPTAPRAFANPSKGMLAPSAASEFGQ